MDHAVLSVGENVCHQGGKLKYNTQGVVRNECWWSVGSDLRSVHFDLGVFHF